MKTFQRKLLRLQQVGAHYLGSDFKILDIKLTLKFKSLKPLRQIKKKLRRRMGEFSYVTDTTNVVSLHIGKDVTLNITHGKKNTAQIQGITCVKDVDLLFLRIKELGLHLGSDPKLSSVLSTIPLRSMDNLNLAAEALNHNNFYFGGVKVYTKNGRAMIKGSSFDNVSEFIKFFASM